MIQGISDIGDKTRSTENHVLELGAIVEVTNERIRDLERDYYPMDRLIEDLTTSRSEVREY